MRQGAIRLHLVELVGSVVLANRFFLVLKHFRRIDALKLALRKLLPMLELLTETASQRAILHLPKLRNTNLRGVEFEGRTHGGEQRDGQAGGVEDEVSLGREAVNGIDDEIVVFEMERIGGGGVIDLRTGGDFGFGVDGEQPFPQHLYLQLTYRFDGGLHLSVEVGDIYCVAIDKSEIADAAADEAFGAPATDAAHTEEDNPHSGEPCHSFGSQQPLGTVEYRRGVVCLILHRQKSSLRSNELIIIRLSSIGNFSLP